VLELVAVDQVDAAEGVEADEDVDGLAVFEQDGVLPAPVGFAKSAAAVLAR
jgi:hypothetical protein